MSIEQPTISPLLYVSEKETLEYLSDGLKEAAAAAKQLAVAQNSRTWAQIALTCANLRLHGLQLAQARSLPRSQTLQILNEREKNLTDKLEEMRKPKLVVN